MATCTSGMHKKPKWSLNNWNETSCKQEKKKKSNFNLSCCTSEEFQKAILILINWIRKLVNCWQRKYFLVFFCTPMQWCHRIYVKNSLIKSSQMAEFLPQLWWQIVGVLLQVLVALSKSSSVIIIISVVVSSCQQVVSCIKPNTAARTWRVFIKYFRA